MHSQQATRGSKSAASVRFRAAVMAGVALASLLFVVACAGDGQAPFVTSSERHVATQDASTFASGGERFRPEPVPAPRAPEPHATPEPAPRPEADATPGFGGEEETEWLLGRFERVSQFPAGCMSTAIAVCRTFGTV